MKFNSQVLLNFLKDIECAESEFHSFESCVHLYMLYYECSSVRPIEILLCLRVTISPQESISCENLFL